MKNLIQCNSIYKDIDALSEMISKMEFEDNLYGSEIKDFNFIPEGIELFFSSCVDDQIEIQSNTGTFRKPTDLIHVEPFFSHCLWVGVAALEDTVLMFHEQENVKTMFDVGQDKFEEFILNNCSDPYKWSVTQTINIRKNEFVFFRPWIWYSLEKDKLVQMFLLNHKIEQKEK